MTLPTSALAIRDAVRSRQISVVEACQASLERIAAADPELNAFLKVDNSGALARAAELDRRHAELSHLSLFGVPVALKDNLCTKTLPTTAGSRVLDGYIPPYDATVVERLEAAGAVIVGKTNCDEFAMGSSTENSAYYPTRNPWAADRTPGGSSGGSAAAVAARLVPAALGSDTGGSIRQPAALCGVVGLKPTYGRVSRFGLVAFASSLDQIGPITTTVADAALMLSAIAGHDPRDATSSTTAIEDYQAALTGDAKGLRIGVPHTLLAEGVDGDVLGMFRAALDVLRQSGAQLVDVELPHSRHAIPVYYLVATAEASSNLARYDGVRYGYRARDATSLGEMYDRTRGGGFGPEVKRRIILGTYVLSAGYYDAYYLKAQQVRTLIRRDYETALGSVDVVAMPTSPTPAFRLGERISDPLQMYLVDVFTVSANLAGLPGLTVPCGFTRDKLPVGLQLIGRAMGEATLLRAGGAFERATSFAREQPVLRLEHRFGAAGQA
jgi:aspartyl-tRNA(Asn)/glutamyl-tRNA(Gln) amidotransferase subunit A